MYGLKRYSTVADRGKRVLKEISKPIQSLLPVVVTLGRTTRHHVEMLKRDTEKLEEGFEKTRQSLLEATKILEGTKSDLQQLYLRREFEYRKVKSDVQVIREINEQENSLKEREEREQLILDNYLKQEQDLFDMTRSSHQVLYDSTRNYAKRYIVIGLTVGSILTLWKGYQYLTNGNTPPPADSTSNRDIIENFKTHTELLLVKLLDEIKSTQNLDLKQRHLTNPQVVASIKQQDMTQGISSSYRLEPSTFSSECLMISIVGLSAGIVGGILPILIYNFCY